MTQTITNMPLYRAIVLENGLGLYIESGKKIIPNRSWTPTNMLRAAGEVTGITFRRGQHEFARQALRRWIEVEKLKGASLSDVVPFTGQENV